MKTGRQVTLMRWWAAEMKRALQPLHGIRGLVNAARCKYKCYSFLRWKEAKVYFTSHNLIDHSPNGALAKLKNQQSTK